MRNAVLVSDMYGRYAEAAYLEQWQAALHQHQFKSQFLYVDDLLPEAFSGLHPTRDSTLLHSRLVDATLGQRGAARLRALIASTEPDVLLGFSYGGWLAFEARDVLRELTPLICISATRIRQASMPDAPPVVNAIFGADDPNRPHFVPPSAGNPFYVEYLLDGIGHGAYRIVDQCLPIVSRILSNTMMPQ